MKPKPISSMQVAIASGGRSIAAPSASSRSAEPQRLVAERLPCFAMRQPAPAATNAAVVETLNVGRPPPVPAVSTRSPPTFTGTARSRIVRARPAISPTVSPFVRSAIRNAAACTSEAPPSMISASTCAASSALRSSPRATRSIAAVSVASGIEEVAQQPFAVGGQDGLGVELDALGGQLAVARAHDHGAGARGDLELVGQVGSDDQRVVATVHERGFEAA